MTNDELHQYWLSNNLDGVVSFSDYEFMYYQAGMITCEQTAIC